MKYSVSFVFKESQQGLQHNSDITWRHDDSNHPQLDCLFDSSFGLTTTASIKDSYHCLYSISFNSSSS